MKVTRVLHAAVNVHGGLGEAGDFYRGLLGLVPTPRPEVPGVEGTWFAVGGVQLHLVGAPSAGGGIDPTGSHVCLGVEDIQAAQAELERRGVPYVRATQDPPPGTAAGGPVVQIWIIDPAGNTVELQQDRG